MNNLLFAVIVILATASLLLLREFVLSVGKRKSTSLPRRTGEPGLPGFSEVQVKIQAVRLVDDLTRYEELCIAQFLVWRELRRQRHLRKKP